MVSATQTKREGKGYATVLAIGTANSPNIYLQSEFPDFFFRVTNSEHHVQLKQKFKRMCDNSNIRKRHFLVDEDILKEHPNISTYGAPSMDTRREIVNDYIPKLGKKAALKCIKEWGQPLSNITHLIFCTSSCINHVPGPDLCLANELGLSPDCNRLVIYDHGCHAGGCVVRVAKNFAENNPGSRVLVVCAETMLTSFQAPSPSHMDILVGHALFGDGAAAMIVGTDPIPNVERPLFEFVFASQSTAKGYEETIHGNITEKGQTYFLGREIPSVVASNVEKCIVDAFGKLGMTVNKSDWNSLFYAIHPGGKAVLNDIEKVLELKEEKLGASRTILREYGNMWSPSVLFILDEMSKRSFNEGKSTTGEGHDWGVLMGFGPGLTIETVVLHSISLQY
ncbi:chalcone synthase-like [Senna tora]|uniref:Chalcone synthase-like n=1 Tax=Senna tora TaxID=362788 RepID=A0A834WJ44_9FABA|nr:chalcone synthase-like [Senna tora]